MNPVAFHRVITAPLKLRPYGTIQICLLLLFYPRLYRFPGLKTKKKLKLDWNGYVSISSSAGKVSLLLLLLTPVLNSQGMKKYASCSCYCYYYYNTQICWTSLQSDRNFRGPRVICSRRCAPPAAARLCCCRAYSGTDRQTDGQTDGHGMV